MKILAANWKMHKTIEDARTFLNRFESLDRGEARVIIIAPFTTLNVFADRDFEFGAQNMHYEEEGAFTGEISPLMLKETGCRYVIIGHSERRNLFKEDDELINKKIISALSHGLRPILCVGESLEEREDNKTIAKIHTQLEKDLDNIDISHCEDIIVAYEPIWAIGTGKTASAEEAAAVHMSIRDKLASMFGEKGRNIPILYGGSAKPDNSGELLSQKDIDGLLVGGASLEPEKFAEMCRHA